MNVIEKIKGQLIVSCQALEHEPLHGAEYMAKMAIAAKAGGAAAIRANGVADIKKIKKVTQLPVIGLIKKNYPGFDIYITPTTKEIKALAKAGCDVIALDATNRPQVDGVSLADKVKLIHELGILALADVSTFDEGVNAEKVGFDLVSTTLSGYTPYSPQDETPDYELVGKLSKTLKIPVIAEGRIYTDEHLSKILEQKPYAVIIGSAITRPQVTTSRFSKIIKEFRL